MNTFQNNHMENIGTGISVRGTASENNFSDFTFDDISSSGVYVYAAAGGLITDNSFDNFSFTNSVLSTNIRLQTAWPGGSEIENQNFSNMDFNTTASYGIYITGNYGGTQSCVFDNINFSSVTTDGIYLQTSAFSPSLAYNNFTNLNFSSIGRSLLKCFFKNIFFLKKE